MAIPELSINPLARRLERVCESLNFKEFVGFLAAFSAKATREDRVRLIFAVRRGGGGGDGGRGEFGVAGGRRGVQGTAPRVRHGSPRRGAKPGPHRPSASVHPLTHFCRHTGL